MTFSGKILHYSLDGFYYLIFYKVNKSGRSYTNQRRRLLTKSSKKKIWDVFTSLFITTSMTLFSLCGVIEAVELPPPANKDRLDQASSNPYVRVSLLPDISNVKETAVKKKTQDPIFEETFAFKVPFPEVMRRTLELKVKDFDKFSRHCVIGRVQIPLENANLGRPCRTWRPLAPYTSAHLNVHTDLYIIFPHDLLQNIRINKSMQNLTSNFTLTDPYVRVSIVLRGRHHKSKKTTVKRNTLEPTYHESFSFRLTSADLRETSIVVTVWDFNAGVVKDEFIGRIVIGKEGSGPCETTHWNSMLASERHAVAQWHTLHSRVDCDQASPASRLVP
ncbi:Synaptotagmin-17 [Armadillidium nasatum]|uniref:Synaptotagmin-17 n=1 Tax=Armadillidium nasatum TaxID=96803 RepID=A0A5N5T984_9CRUS|nr:Synaptotagmin-17 [Armadillidium nasatum]